MKNKVPFSTISPAVEGEFSSYFKSRIAHACPRDFVSLLDIGQDLRALSSKNKLPFLSTAALVERRSPKLYLKNALSGHEL